MTLTILARQSKPGSRAYSGERLVNYFARPADGVSPLVLISRGGLVETADTGTASSVRAITKMGGDLYAVSGGKVWKVTTSGAVTEVGAVTDGETSMAANRTQVAITVGGKYYVCDGATTSEYSPGALSSAARVAEADGYMIVIGSGAGFNDTMQISDLNDATAFDAIDFAVAEYQPDALVGVIHDHKQIYLFGSDTTEVWYNSGSAAFPFQPNPAAVVEHGCKSAATIAKADSAVFWVRPDCAVVMNFGGSPQVISTPEIKAEIERSTITGGFTFSENGHEFYCVTREGNTSLVFDITTRTWHERAYGLSYGAWQAVCRVQFGGVDYFGCSNGKIATLSSTKYDDFGDVLMSEFETPLQMNGGEYFRVPKLHIDVDSSTGGIGRTPRAMLQVSRDGFTWGDEIWRSIADKGEYGKRVTWFGLGQLRRGKIRFRITDAVKRDVIGGKAIYG